MAVDVCSEISSLCTSPRLSFSRDRNETDTRRTDSSLLDPGFDFDFSIGNTRFNQELPSADELFSDGKILPIEINKTAAATTKKTHHSKTSVFPTRPGAITRSTSKSVIEDTEKKRLIEFLSMEYDEEEEKQPVSKSFWQFRRSTSLNCDNGHSASLIRSLQFLSRSHSTGSAPNPKRRAVSKYTQKQNSLKEPPAAAFSPPSHYGYYPYNSSKRPPRKNCSRSYGNGVRISPVLNIPPSCMAGGSASLFGLICIGKAKKKK
ncbi:hypothetical protein RHGRI_026880 [Rhododendron griersonianum]|uniref:Membrane-associated kinase regulator n=1 Tax=Rhododendron griersonianum TaxID=479676 RepID=A0AAV6IWP6_9ERIC|nr:hypothetical protein RHGRI_026880 [Rhododendron griersonianum]